MAAVLPAGGLAFAAGQGDAAGQVAIRAWEAFTAWLFERAVLAVTRVQVLFEALISSAGKGTAVVAAGAAVASGGTVAMDQVGRSPSSTGGGPVRSGLVAATADAVAVARRVERREQRREVIRRSQERASVLPTPQAPSPPASSTPPAQAQEVASPVPAGPPAPEASRAEFGLE